MFRQSFLAILVLTLLLAIASVLSAEEVPAPAARASSVAEDRVLVAFKPDVPLTRRLDSVQRFGLEVDPGVQSAHFARLRIGRRARAVG